MGDATSPAPDQNYTDVGSSYILDLNISGPIAYALTALLALGFLAEITRFRFWQRNLVLQLLLSLSKSPLVHWIGQFQAFIINAPYYNELYFVWGVLLTTGFSSFYSIIEYRVYTRNKTKLMKFNEKIHLINSFSVLALLLYYTLYYTKVGLSAENFVNMDAAPSDYDSFPGRGNFVSILWVIWGFSLIKSLYQIISYYYDDCSYGSADTKLVSFYMTKQKKVSNFDPKNMTGYRYLLVDEKPLIVSTAPTYEIIINDGDLKNLITLEDVWLSKAQLLNCSLGDKLKDVCLSFALFKMLKRRFEEECETAEADRPETRDFIRRGLLESLPERVFEVIDMELRFLRDLFYTKYPTVLGFGFPIYTLLFVTLFSSFIIILSKLHHYKPPKHDIHKKNNHNSGDEDVVVTIVILFTIMMIEAWEFYHYIFSNWSKVLLVCKYLKCQKFKKFLDYVPINMLWMSCRICIPKQKKYEIGQYSLLQSCKIFSCNCCYRDKFIGLGYINRLRTVKHVSLKKVTIMEAILPSLKNFLDTGLHHPTKITALSTHGIEGKLPSWACELQNNVQTVMMWHVATNFCWMITKSELKKKRRNTNEPVAVNFSNYCAYLVVCAPELLPINTYVCNLISRKFIQETREFFQTVSKDEMVQKMEMVEESEESVICRGARLGKKLRNLIGEGENLWDLLKDVWVELMLRLAPSDTSIAHANKLAEGGEFMTYLWVLLYHAGLLNQASFKDGTASMP